MIYSEYDIYNYVKSLDIQVVSFGGVGTNYLIYFLKYYGNLSTMNDIEYHRLVCHYPEKLPNTKTIFLYGDLKLAILSQYSRNTLHKTASKIHYKCSDANHDIWHYISKFPDDPIGIKKIIANYVGTPNTVFVQYPFDKTEIHQALKTLGFSVDMSKFKLKKRKTEIKPIESYPKDVRLVLEIYQKYYKNIT